MSTKLYVILTVAALALLLGALAGDPASAADANTAVAIGSIDADRVFNEYEKRIQLYQNLANLKAELEQKLALRNDNLLLTDAEFKQLLDLKLNPKQQEADAKKIEELLAISRQRDKELETLQQKQDATDAEKARRTELANQKNNVTKALEDERENYQTELDKQTIEANREVALDVQTAVADVAKNKNLAIVFNKSFGAIEFVLYSSNDITDDVLKRLNKK